PALTDELLELGKWLANQTMSLYITTYQAMLPQVLKSKYERTLVRLEKNLPEELSLLFNGLDEIYYNLIHESNINLETIQKAYKNSIIKEQYKIKSKKTKKYKTNVYPSEATIHKEYEKNLPQNAHRQKQILNYFIENNKKIDQRILFEHLGITRTHLKPLIDKQLITLEQEEIYRNPYEREYPKTEKKTLTQE